MYTWVLACEACPPSGCTFSLFLYCWVRTSWLEALLARSVM
jgi:hypothetical protein